MNLNALVFGACIAGLIFFGGLEALSQVVR